MITDQECADRAAHAADEQLSCLQDAAGEHDLSRLRALTERERQAREELVLANVRVATSIAARYRNNGEPMEELVQTAYLGLVKAANGFVPERGSGGLG